MTHRLLDKQILQKAKHDENFMNDLLYQEDAQKFIRYVIKTYTKSPEKFMLFNRIEFEEMIHLCVIGLYKGIANADLKKDPKEIQRYLYLRIQEQLREVARSNNSNQVSINQSIRSLYPSYLKYHNGFFVEHHRDPNIAEVMSHFEISEDDAYELVYGMQASISDTVQREGETISLFDYLECITGSLENRVIKKIMLEEKFALLGKKEREVIELKYLMEYNNTEISNHLNCSNSMVGKYIRQAFSQMGMEEVKVPRTVGANYRLKAGQSI